MAKKTTIKGIGKRALAIFLTLVMVTSMFNIGALAAPRDRYPGGNQGGNQGGGTTSSDELPSNAFSNGQSVYVAYRNSNGIPSEPDYYGADPYSFYNGTYSSNPRAVFSSDFIENFAANASYHYNRKEDVKVWGITSAVGHNNEGSFSNSFVNDEALLKFAFDNNSRLGNYEREKDNYRVVIYVVKFQDDTDWHIDYVVVPQTLYSVAYNANGGANPPAADHELSEGSTYTVKGTGSMAREGYTFVEWNTQADGQGTSYDPSDEFEMPASDVYLYAIWEAETPDPVYYDLTVNYVDEAGQTLAATITETKTEGDEYSTIKETIDGYTFKEMAAGSDPASGTMTSDKEVTYVYSKNPVYYTLTVKYVDEAGQTLAATITETKTEGDEYSTIKETIDGYTFKAMAAGSDPATGTMSSDKTVIYVYSKNPEQYTLIVNYVDEDGAELAATITETKTEGDAYTTTEKTFEGYTFKEVTGDDATGTMDSDKEVTYVYKLIPAPEKYTVSYEYTGEVPADAPAVPGSAEYEAGASVTVAGAPALEGYTFSGWSKSDFEMPAEDVVIQGSWTENAPVNPPEPPAPPATTEYTLTVNYVDEAGQTLADTVTETKTEGTEYTTTQKSIEGYTFKKTTGDEVSGTMDSDKTVTYVYSKNPEQYTLTVNYIDEDGAELAATITETKTEGDEYTTTEKTFEGYTFKEVTGDDASGIMDENKEVTYVYEKDVPPAPAEYTLIVNYVDENGAELADTDTETKTEGAAYSTSAKSIDGYSLKTTEGDAVSGIMDGNKEVTYVYEENAPVNPPEPPAPPAATEYTLTVNHVDEVGATLAATTTETKDEGAAYSTSAKSIEGYTFKTTSGDATSGTMDSDKTVTYIYSKNTVVTPEPEPPVTPPVVVKYRVVYKYTGTVPAGAPKVPGTSRYKANVKVSVAGEPSLEGYTFSGWSTDDASVSGGSFKMPRRTVTLTGSWEKIPEKYALTVNYVDESGAELAGTISKTYTEGDAYTTSQKSFEGYAFEYTTGDATSGTMNSDKEVTYVYSKIPAKYNLTVNYVDETGAELAGTISKTYTEGDAYTTSQKSFEGYTFEYTTGDATSGIMDSDKEVTYVYSEIPVIDVPEEDVPLVEEPEIEEPEIPVEPPVEPEIPVEPPVEPEIPVEPPVEPEIPVEPPVEPEVPVEPPVIDIPEEDVPLVDIPEEDVPLADVPETGDQMILWIAAAISSALGLAWLALTEKKRQRV